MARSIDAIRKLYPYSDNCLDLEKTIGKLNNDKSYQALRLNGDEIQVLNVRLKELNAYYDKITCEMIIGNSKLEKVSQIVDKYGELDEIRIEAENSKAVKNRIYIGVGIMLASVGIILIANRK
jgi:hypothetical protein